MREAVEREVLAPGATVSAGAGRRARPEEPDELRTCFERDRDRIVHSTAFRRLAGKTQVFLFPDDHQRTRLTHALEVAQVALAIARACRANEALTEAIALGHDCGHGPGGHASEPALAAFLPDGFDHAPWGADVVLADLNLCAETLDGIRNHSWSRPPPATPEGEIVSWADRIAYVCHDYDDARRSGIVTPSQLPDLVVRSCGREPARQLSTFVRAMVEATTTTGQVSMTPGPAEALAAFRAFNHETIYQREASRRQNHLVEDMLTALTAWLTTHPETVPAHIAPGADPTRRAVTWVAGMTDRFACKLATQHIAWPVDRLPRGFDLFG